MLGFRARIALTTARWSKWHAISALPLEADIGRLTKCVPGPDYQNDVAHCGGLFGLHYGMQYLTGMP